MITITPPDQGEGHPALRCLIAKLLLALFLELELRDAMWVLGIEHGFSQSSQCL